MMFRKCFVPVTMAAAVLLVATCLEPQKRSVSVKFVTPTNNQRVLPGVVPVTVQLVLENCFIDSVTLSVDGAVVGSQRGEEDTCHFTWDASNAAPGSKPRLTAVAHCIYFGKDVSDVKHLSDSSVITVLVDTGGPDIKIVSPQEGDTFARGNVPITVWAKDDGTAGMDRVEFLVDEVLEGTDSDGDRDTWRYTWDASQAGPGSHAIKARAYNGSGEIAVEAITVAIRDTGSGGGPTYHHGYIDTSETWSPNGNPHIVDADVVFRNGARLTIGPGCIVKFDSPFQLYFGYFGPSGLSAVGTASAPILFTSNLTAPAPGAWYGITFGDSTLTGTRLSYCTIEYGGAPGTDGAAINIINGGSVDEISNCTIRKSGMHGVRCQANSGFGTFSDNVVTSNLGYALRVNPQLAERIQAGNALTGNDSAGVELTGRCSLTTTWPDLGVPYVISKVTVGDSTNDPVLTIESGVELRFKQWGELAVGMLGRNLPARIVADGITFTSAAGSPAPGDFDRVRVYEGPSAESEFRDCNFSYGGQGGGDNGMLWVHGRNPVITSCDFGHSAGWGITFCTAQVPDTVTLKQLNTFHDNASGAIKWIHLFAGD
jgi:hypothetical protein